MNIFDIDACQEIIEYLDKNMFLFMGSINKRTSNLYKKIHGSSTSMTKVCKDTKATDIISFINIKNDIDTAKWCAFSIKNHRMDMLLLMRNCGFQYDTESSLAAAEMGDLNLLKWVVNDGCPWDERVILRAAIHGFDDIVDWVILNSHTSVDHVQYFLPGYI